MLRRVFFFICIASRAWASDSWQRVDFSGTEAFTLIHDDGISYFSVYPFAKNPEPVQRLMNELARDPNILPDRTYFPALCYPIARKDLKSTQTWCDRGGGGSLAIVEEGVNRLAPSERAALVLAVLGKPIARSDIHSLDSILAWLGLNAKSAHAESCSRDPSPHASFSPEYKAAVICLAAEQEARRRTRPSLWDVLTRCGNGTSAGANDFKEQLWDTARFLGGASVNLGVYAAEGAMMTMGLDPLFTLELMSRKDVATASSAITQTRQRIQAAGMLFDEFIRELDDNSRLIGASLACLPWDWKMHYVCEFFSNVILNLAAIDGVTAAANKGAQVVKSVGGFMARTNLLPELRSLSFSDRLGAAATSLERTSGYTVLYRSGNLNVLTREHAITGETRFSIQEFTFKDGNKVSEIDDVVKDGKTGALDANSDAGIKVSKIVARESQGDFVVSADVMDLGKTNYFKGFTYEGKTYLGGQQAGNLYLQQIAAAMRESMRPGDLLFRTGGDELSVILRTKDPKAVMAFQERVHDAIARDPLLQAMFRKVRLDAAQAARVVPRESPDLAKRVAALQDAARVRPGVSMGAARIKGGSDPWSDALELADCQAGEVKACVKAARGADVSKYGRSADSNGARPVYDAAPAVLTPIE